jgi:hypothetical protein
VRRTKELTVSGVESFPGEFDTLRADNARLRHLLQLSEEQARAAASDQATLTGAPAAPLTMGSSSADKARFFFDLFRCRTDDEHTPVIASSLKKRAPGYLKMGFPDPRKMSRQN